LTITVNKSGLASQPWYRKGRLLGDPCTIGYEIMFIIMTVMHILTMQSTQSVGFGGVESDDSDNSEEDNSSHTQEDEMGGIASLVETSFFPACLCCPSCIVA
jgi:hypothetical protein